VLAAHSFTFGDPVRWGTQNRVEDAGECCRQCREYKPKTDNDPSCNGEPSAAPATVWRISDRLLRKMKLRAGWSAASQPANLAARIELRSVHNAVWVWCGDSAGCKDHYK
jgi:hypothetical protein